MDNINLDDLETLMQNEFFRGSQYTYSPLIGSGIRLLKLDRGAKQANLSGSILHVSFDDKPKYEALSYAWGIPVKDHTIDIEGCSPLPITESLYVALKQLRHLHKSRLLWIDAICINQDDDSEKSHQILLMYQIYSIASCVLCWLGEEGSTDSGIAIRLTQKVQATDFSPLKTSQVTDSFMKACGFPERTDRQWKAVEDFWQRPWFKRAWIVQEFAAGTTVKILCGSNEIDWKILGDGAEKIRRYKLLDQWAVQSRMGKIASWDGTKSFANMAQNKILSSSLTHFDNGQYWIDFFAQRDDSCMREIELVNTLEPITLRRAVLHQKNLPFKLDSSYYELMRSIFNIRMPQLTTSFDVDKPSLIYLGTMHIAMECSDPKDKLFAYLAMSRDAEVENLRPDYSESVMTVYTRFARYYVTLNGYNATRCLALAGIGFKCMSTLDNLPSWVPDWSIHNLVSDRVLGSNMIESRFSANGKSEKRFRLGDNENEIYATGSLLGRVEQRLTCPRMAELLVEMGNERVDSMNEIISTIEPVMKSIRDMKDYMEEVESFISKHKKSHPDLYSKETELELLLRVPICNCDLRGFEPDDLYRQDYEGFRVSINEVQSSLASMNFIGLLNELFKHTRNVWTQQWGNVNASNVLCQLDTGFLAMVPAKTQVGDAVYISHGLSVPITLRAFEKDINKYQLLGICYVHGMMTGEALDLDNWKEEEICLV